MTPVVLVLTLGADLPLMPMRRPRPLLPRLPRCREKSFVSGRSWFPQIAPKCKAGTAKMQIIIGVASAVLSSAPKILVPSRCFAVHVYEKPRLFPAAVPCQFRLRFEQCLGGIALA